jgi:hypothetical protein
MNENPLRAGIILSYKNINTIEDRVGGEDTQPDGATYTCKLVRKQYQEEGVFTSGIIDSGASSYYGAYYGALEFNADIPAKTTLQFQVRAGATSEDITAMPFTGPAAPTIHSSPKEGKR